MVKKNQSTALVPTPKLHAPAIKKTSQIATVKLVGDKTILEDKEEVRTKLPDILGRVLACIWIDPEFYHSFSNDPKRTLEKNGVFLPQDIFLDFEKPSSDRPKVVVSCHCSSTSFNLTSSYPATIFCLQSIFTKRNSITF